MSYITLRVKTIYYALMIKFYMRLYSLAVEALCEFTMELDKLGEEDE